MQVFLTGGTGFIGSEVALKLRRRGDEVRALVRTPSKAARLEDAGCDLVQGDVTDDDAIRAGMSDCQAVIHCAGMYEVGIKPERRPAMYEANVVGTQRVLQAALDLGVPRAIYVSTVGVFGNTRGKVVDESAPRQSEFISYYDETKYEAHQIAEKLIGEGLPGIIVMPGFTYGPGDRSDVARIAERFIARKLPALPYPEVGASYAHRDDIADGILLALDKGRVGESYVLGGEIATQGDFFATLARLLGRKPPRKLPAFMVKMSAPLGPLIGPAMGFPPNFRESIKAAEGVTYWATHEKATRELGYSPRSMEQGIKDMLAAR